MEAVPSETILLMQQLPATIGLDGADSTTYNHLVLRIARLLMATKSLLLVEAQLARKMTQDHGKFKPK